MFTAPVPSFAEWKKVLMDIGVKESHVTECLIGILCAHDFTLPSLNEESFHEYYSGSTEEDIGVDIAKQFSSLNPLQEFLEPIIDWDKAWQSLKRCERYVLVQVNEPGVWALFAKE